MKTGRTWMGSLAVAALLTALLVGGGCSESEVDSDSSALVAPSAGAEASLWMPTLSEIEAATGLTPGQRDGLAPAFLRWREAVRPHMEASQSGLRKGRGARFAEGGEVPDHERPFLDLVEECARVLEPEQFVNLAEFLAERREAHRQTVAERRHGGFGRGRGGGFPGRHFGPGEGPGQRFEEMAEELDLTHEQGSQAQAALEEHHEAMRALHTERVEGNLDRDTFRERALELRNELKAKLQGILDSSQLERMEERRAERQAQMAERREARLDRMVEHRTGFLSRVLDLSDSQEQQVGEIIESAREDQRALTECLRAGEIEPEEAREQMGEIRDSTASAIRELLTPEQQVLFDALQDLVPGPGRWGRHH